jgi:hypothetical protein
MNKEQFLKKWSNNNVDFENDLNQLLNSSKIKLPNNFLDIDKIYDAWSEPKNDYDLGVRAGIEITWDAINEILKPIS